ncbi:MAG TPA: bifunctional acetate--CoA ligase family protein/GNAT family N-acetyltransferase [Stellaceae bacterium]|nr:bifunctional acetate--CoA ligase family protein/GNAT family N-acetyltransferase [Stellaceae bacterium]
MSIRNLDELFHPRSVALIGATDRAGSVGAVVMRNLRRAGLHGELMLVSPHHQMLDGMQAYPDVASLPQIPDMAVIVTPPSTVPGLIAELGARGTRAAVVITAGFGELGADGHALQQAALDAARPYLLRLVGPNCVGIMVPGIGLDASFSHLAPPPGDIAFVSQSGAMITAMLDWAAPRGIGFSHVVSLGDMADVDFGDMLDYLSADARTRAILLYVEGVTHGRKFMSAARAASRAKPVLVLKAGHSPAGAKAAHSHTGALAGSDAVYDAAFARAGMLRVGTMAELFDATETLALTREQEGDGLAIVSNGGGAGVLATDALAVAGGRLAELAPETIARLDQALPPTWSRGNPVDIIGDAPGARYAAAIEVLLGDSSVDALLVLNCPTALASPDEAAKAVVDTFAEHQDNLRGRNIFTAWLGEQSAAPARRRFEAARIPTYDAPEAAVSGFLHRVRYQHSQALLMETPPARPDPFEPDVAAAHGVVAATLAAGKTWLDPDDVAVVLAAYGISQPLARNAADADEAAETAAGIGFPVALKIRSPDITHKSDVGGVALGLRDAVVVRDAVAAMLDRVRVARPEARIDGILVQQMIERPGAVELLAGLSDDPVFGPVVVFGQGGTAVEIVNDSAIALPPLNSLLARSQMERTRVWKLLQAYRGKPAAAIGAIEEVLIRLGQLAADHPEICELDINPLLAAADGVVAIDARIRVALASTPGAARLAIAPYPKHLESTALARDGTSIALRPVRPDDEPLLQDLFAHMSHEDQRLRFFAPMRELSHPLAARLSQIDYDREMALIAQHDGATIGIVRYFADPDRLRAEYAVAVRSDWKGRGVGYLLMTRIIEVAQEAGIGELFGEVLHENKPMLDMCRTLGFSLAANPRDATLTTVSKPLAAARA